MEIMEGADPEMPRERISTDPVDKVSTPADEIHRARSPARRMAEETEVAAESLTVLPGSCTA